MKRITNIFSIMITFVLFIHLGHNYAFSQQERFQIKLKNGAEIFSPSLLIKDGFVFYRFTSYGNQKVGISISSVKQIFKIIKNGERQPIDIHNPPKSLTKEKMVNQ